MHRFITGGLVGLALVLSPVQAHAQSTMITPAGEPIVAQSYAEATARMAQDRPSSWAEMGVTLVPDRWVPVRTFNETGSMTTERFTVSGPWRLVWYNQTSRTGSTSLYVHTTDGHRTVASQSSREETHYVRNHERVTTRTGTLLHPLTLTIQEPGDYYINSYAEGNWTATVQELRVSLP